MCNPNISGLPGFSNSNADRDSFDIDLASQETFDGGKVTEELVITQCQDLQVCQRADARKVGEG